MSKFWKMVILLGGILLAPALARADGVGEPPVFWLQGEYLTWFVNRQTVNGPLVTTTNSPDLLLSNGTLGQTGISTLSGDGLSSHGMPGFRVSGGAAPDWFLPMEFSYFRLEQSALNFAGSSDSTGTPVLARPLTTTQGDTPLEGVELIAFPGVATGNVVVRNTTRLWGADGHVVGHLFQCDGVLVDALAGFRYLSLNEDLFIQSTTTPLVSDVTFFNGSTVPVGQSVVVIDQFGTRNHFYGGQVGLRGVFKFSNAFTGAALDVRGRLGIGQTNESATINGSSSLLTAPGVITTLPGGLLATGTNSTTYLHHRFSLIPEVTTNLRYDLSKWLSLTVGYNFLYWGKVLRPGALVNRAIDTRQVVTDPAFTPGVQATSPVFQLNEKSFWVQGVNVGLQVTF